MKVNVPEVVTEIPKALDRSTSTIRHHLRELRRRGLVERYRFGQVPEDVPDDALAAWRKAVGDRYPRPWRSRAGGNRGPHQA